jgi:SAM-dependent methyltransferase
MPPSFVQVTTTLPLDRLRHELADAPPLPALSGAEYARTHAVYEAASDQRGLLREWLVREVPPLLAEHDPVRVVGVGVGEGALDVPLAAALARGGRAVRYTGVEPHPPAASAFLAGLAGLAAPSLVPAVVVGDFARHDPGHPADLVHFVHSLYYVEDLERSVDHALALLRPGGLLLAATAPREPLCVLTELLGPWLRSGPWFAEDVRTALAGRGLHVRTETVAGRLDVADVLADGGSAVLDFLVGADAGALAPAARAAVLDHLRGLLLDATRVPHPIEVVLARVPG